MSRTIARHVAFGVLTGVSVIAIAAAAAAQTITLSSGADPASVRSALAEALGAPPASSAPTRVAAAAPAAASASARPFVRDLRVGVHPGATRIVLDVSAPIDMGFEVAQDGHAVFVDLPAAEWRAGQFAARHAQGLLTDYSFSAEGGSGRLSLLTSEPVQIKRPFFVSPDGDKGHRIVIELVAHQAPAQAQAMLQPAAYTAPASTATEPPADVTMQPRVTGEPQSRSAPPPQADAAAAEDPQVAQAAPRIMPPAQPRTMAPMEPSKSVYGGLVYVRGGAGLTIMGEADGEGGGTSFSFDTDPGYALSGALGIDFADMFRLEGEVFYTGNGGDSFTIGTSSLAFATGDVDGDISNLAFMANAAYDFSASPVFQPYVFGGVGVARVAMNDVTILGTKAADDSDWVLAGQIGVGGSMALNERVVLDASYRYFLTQDPEMSDTGGVPFEFENSSHSFMLGARYKF